MSSNRKNKGLLANLDGAIRGEGIGSNENDKRITIQKPTEIADGLEKIQDELALRLQNAKTEEERVLINEQINEILARRTIVLSDGKEIERLPVRQIEKPKPEPISRPYTPPPPSPTINFNEVTLNGERIRIITDSRPEKSKKFDKEVELTPEEALLAFEYRFKLFARKEKGHPSFNNLRSDWYERKSEYWSDIDEWERIKELLLKDQKLIDSICMMENSGHEPQVFMADFENFYIGTCSHSVPRKHTNLVYDEFVIEKIKRSGAIHIPKCAIGVAKEMGCKIMTKTQSNAFRQVMGSRISNDSRYWIFDPKKNRSIEIAMQTDEEQKYYGLRVILTIPWDVPDTEEYITKEEQKAKAIADKKAEEKAKEDELNNAQESKNNVISQLHSEETNPKEALKRLKERFFRNWYKYHKSIFENIKKLLKFKKKWKKIKKILKSNPEAFKTICKLEQAGHEPAVYEEWIFSEPTFITSASKAPTYNEKIVYDNYSSIEGLGAIEIAKHLGCRLIDRYEYCKFAKKGKFNKKQSCWIDTDENTRAKGFAHIGKNKSYRSHYRRKITNATFHKIPVGTSGPNLGLRFVLEIPRPDKKK